MAIATHTTKSITNDLQKYKEKENRKPEGQSNLHHQSSNSGSSGSVPKRYQSVYTEGTPLTSFGIRDNDNQKRTHSPPNHMQSQHHQRPLKPVKEFLTTQSIGNQQLDDRRRLPAQTNSYNRSQTDATVQNVNVALAKTLNTLRQEPLSTVTTNGHSASLYTAQTPTRPMTGRATSRHYTNSTATSNFYYQLSGGSKGPLPAELITRRPVNSLPSNDACPAITQQSTTPMRNDIRSTDTINSRGTAPFYVPAKSLDTGLQQTNRFEFESVIIDDYPDKFRSKYESNPQLTTRTAPSRQSTTPRSPSVDNQHRSLPEVSVNPHIQSSIPKNNEQISQFYEPIQNGFSNNHIHSNIDENHSHSNANINQHHHRHRHIQVEPTNTFKRGTSSQVKHQHIADVQPNIIVQHQRSTLGSNSTTNTATLPTRKDSLNEAYIERDNTDKHLLTAVNTYTNNNDNDSTSTLKQYDIQQERRKGIVTPPSSPAAEELDRIWNKQQNKYSFRSMTINRINDKNSKVNRPPGRLKNYDESDTETTATETQSKDEDMARRHVMAPSDLGSDAWSDLTSEFSDTKFRKHPNIRTSTPNMTRQSSSQSSKEVGQIRKQLSDLQIMYNDLLKLLDVDIESVRSSHKSSTSSHAEHNNRKHRFRKVMPVTSMRHSNLDMREVNQRFTRLETSIVTLAESIAKLSAQIQMQRLIKDDVQQLRQEVAELRQQIHHPNFRNQSSTPINTNGISSTTSQQQTRLLSPNIQRLATVNSSNPLNISTSYMPSTSTIQRGTSIIDPRQARKIEQFFGTEAMLRYFLSLLNYEEYAPVLEREKIGIYELPYINERKLQSFGIPYGPCARIIYEAQQYFISLLTLRSSGIDV